MPRQLERWDGRSKKIAGWYADKQRRRGGIMLGQGDTLRIPMMEQGRFQVIAYLLGRSKQRPVPVALGRIDVRHQPDAGPQRVTVKVDAERLRQALAELARRDAAGGARGGQGGQRRVP
jgi:hypothetical protein